MGRFPQESRLIHHLLPMNSSLHREIRVPSSAQRPLTAVTASLYKPAPVRTVSSTFGSFFTHNLPVATFYKLPSGWRAQVARHGVRKSRACFPTKTAAQAWANKVEAEIIGGEVSIPNLTLDSVFERYGREVSEGKKGRKWEQARIGLVRRDPLALVRLRDFTGTHVAQWRDRRLQSVSGASVRREWNLLGHACETAVYEWGWLKSNPFGKEFKVKRPTDGKSRKRIATPEEIERLTGAASENLRRVIVFALETGMRAGEIASLKPEDIYGKVAIIRDSKNGTSREVPLSKVALEQINGRPSGDSSGAAEQVKCRGNELPPPTLFRLTAGSISAMFARLTAEVGIEGLTFHDLRRTAIVRLAKKLDPLTLAKMVGHLDLKMTLNVYYQADMGKVAALLD